MSESITPNHGADEPVYGISVAAQLLGVPEATLRALEGKGVLSPARTDGGTRRYSDDDLARARRISALRAQGLNVAGIRHVLDLEDANTRLRNELDRSRGRAEPPTVG